ncbi:ribokinase [Eupransor demetentiae]|uniref:Ribokinase n=1 Tax=Eupransor demetentiae TaxID=3109584 RepID=A0ABM9N7F7_9LACO|nr:Sugar or nucleoside kinase [Lactobacillaceae bacterium LMG 33000]
MTKVITVLGSTNIDKVVRVPRFAHGGETLKIDNHTIEVMGGKGLNQAVAAARSGVLTQMITKVGQEFDLAANMADENLNTDGVLRSATEETGQAYIMVSKASGDNMIYIYGGANADMTKEDVATQADLIAKSDFLIAQLEIPVEAVIAGFKIAKEAGVTTILNPAPMPEFGDLPEDLLNLTDIIIPNKHETALLTGVNINNESDLDANAAYFMDRGMHTVMITLGSKGAFYMTSDGKKGMVPSFKVAAVDTTAAGDTFIGAMATRLHANLDNIEEAMRYGSAASSLTVSRRGAQPSIPTEDEVLKVLGQ